MHTTHHWRGQTLVELALALPLLTSLLFGIIVFGTGVFYQQQVTNAAREAARYAALHSASDPFCPTVGNRDPAHSMYLGAPTYPPGGCDRPADGWPKLTAAARDATFGIDRSGIDVAACWSSFWHLDASGNKDTSGQKWDALPPTTTPPTTAFFDCRIGGIDPQTDSASIPCPAPATSVADDEGSALPGNQVTVYVCYRWTPPLAGFLLLPEEIVMRGVVTELIHRQQ